MFFVHGYYLVVGFLFPVYITLIYETLLYVIGKLRDYVDSSLSWVRIAYILKHFILVSIAAVINRYV